MNIVINRVAGCLALGLLFQSPALRAANTEVATLAGGCFWCVESDLEKLPGVISVVSGYTGGRAASPDYESVSAGGTGHTEAVEVRFDPAILSFEKLLNVFWHSIDPLTPDAQFCDRGSQYRSAIYYHGDAQKAAVERSKQALEKSGRFKSPIVTQIAAAGTFYPAEDYHQDYYKKNPIRYNYYRRACGRDQRVKELWGGAAHD